MRIGLLAMSGIRVVDAELLRLGLTLPGFVERSKTIASLPSLGLLTLAGMTPERHEASYLEVPDPAELEELPAGFDLVAISSYSAQIGEAYGLADRFRRAGVPVVLGGPHVSVLPEEAGEHADAVVVGEGEPAWEELLADAEAGRLKPRYGALDGSFDLSEAPMPAFELLDVARYNRLTVQTSRGCPHLCEFCASSVVLSPRYKQKPVGKVVAEIERILEIWDHPFLEFADDNSVVNRAWWRELLGALEGRRFRWFTETDLSVSEDGELLDLMRASGCAQLLIGLESPVEEGLRGLELRSDWKHARWERYREAIEEIQSHGITVNGCFVLGLDGHGPGVFDEVLRFAEESGLYEVQVTIQTAFPGTPLHERLREEGRILEEGRWDKCTLFDVNYEPAGMSAEELEAGFRRLAVELYSEERTRRRRERFRSRLRERRREEGDRPS
jgi:radical SAM superfamily enzyme YgiQ (UPF0313 family)